MASTLYSQLDGVFPLDSAQPIELSMIRRATPEAIVDERLPADACELEVAEGFIYIGR